MRENKSRCLPSEKGTGSFLAGVAGTSAIVNGNALCLLLLRVIWSSQPLPHIEYLNCLVWERYASLGPVHQIRGFRRPASARVRRPGGYEASMVACLGQLAGCSLGT